MNDGNSAPVPALVRMIQGYRISQMLRVAAKLGLADLLAESPQSSAALAARTGVHAGALQRLLLALTSVGVFREEDAGRFALTPLAEPLRGGVPGSVRDLAIFSGDSQIWRAWGDLDYSVATGEPAFDHVWGMTNWDYRAAYPAANAVFDAAMTSNARRDLAAILAAYDFAGCTTLVDVGGGQGALLAGILQAHPALRGILFDQSHVVSQAGPLLEAAGVVSRCGVVAGSFFAEVPAGGDAYLLRRIIHDWNDEQALLILQQCQRAMAPQTLLLLVEGVVQPANQPDPVKLDDLNMLVVQGGCERTAAEFQLLLERAGFALRRIVPTASVSRIIEAVRV